MEKPITIFITELSSKAPIPGIGVITTSVLLKHTIQSAVRALNKTGSC